MIQNGSFSEGWETLDAISEANYLRNQRPNGWQIAWLPIGAALYDDPHTKVKGIPECVHKLNDQLPLNERLGQKDALILSGDAVYKIFSATAEFGAQLSQTVSGLQPSSQANLLVPIQVHLHGETDAYAAESGVWVNGQGSWVNGFDMGDRHWYEHTIEFTVPPSGEAEILIRVKSKWPSPKDFFFDGITLTAEAATKPKKRKGKKKRRKTVFLQVPTGVQVKQGTSPEKNVVEINVGPGVKLKVVSGELPVAGGG